MPVVPVRPNALSRVRRICLSLPVTSERLSHGSPTWFIRERRSFATYMDDHHGDGRLALWLAARPGVQAALVKKMPDQYFVPPYVAHLGWLGMHLDRGLSWDEIEARLEGAHQAVAEKLPTPRGRRARA